MVATGVEFDHVTGEMEGYDLAATIVSQLVTSHRTGLDLVKIFADSPSPWISLFGLK